MTENGFAPGAVLIKAEAQKREREQIQSLIAGLQRKTLAQNQTREGADLPRDLSVTRDTNFLKSVLESGATGRVIIDLDAILAGDKSADIEVGDGDSLFLPTTDNTVSVIGEVRQPGAFKHDEDHDVNSYLQFAAGTTVRADSSEVYIVRASGKVDRVERKASLLSFSQGSSQELQPGDTIVVPIDEEYQPVLAKYREITSVVFQSVASLYPLFRL